MLAKITVDKKDVVALTKNVHRQFVISFKYKLINKYTFKEMKECHLRPLQSFLDKVSGMSVDEVDKMFKRKPDKTDTYKDKQVQHYEVNGKFRIHGIFENDRFKILRIDPEHKFH